MIKFNSVKYQSSRTGNMVTLVVDEQASDYAFRATNGVAYRMVEGRVVEYRRGRQANVGYVESVEYVA